MACIRICSIDGCGKRHEAHGYCKDHYWRFRQHGDALAGGKKRPERGAPLRWLEEHVRHSGDGCLIWPFSRKDTGYGQLMIGRKCHRAHRLMCTMAHGEPPTKKHGAAHSCGRGDEGCVNPNHLRWATVIENMADKVAHGTQLRGSQMAMAVLTEETVLQIASLKGKRSAPEIAASFGLRADHVNQILRGVTWSWLTGIKSNKPRYIRKADRVA